MLQKIAEYAKKIFRMDCQYAAGGFAGLGGGSEPLRAL